MGKVTPDGVGAIDDVASLKKWHFSCWLWLRRGEPGFRAMFDIVIIVRNCERCSMLGNI